MTNEGDCSATVVRAALWAVVMALASFGLWHVTKRHACGHVRRRARRRACATRTTAIIVMIAAAAGVLTMMTMNATTTTTTTTAAPTNAAGQTTTTTQDDLADILGPLPTGVVVPAVA
jgi:hypothetical protein